MAIDMIEQSDLPAMMLGPKRDGYVRYYNTLNEALADKTEGDDGDYSNFSLIGSLFPGQHRLEKKVMVAEGAATAMATINQKYPIPATCERLLALQDELNNEIYNINQKILSGSSANSMKPWMDAYTARLTIVKNKINSMKCEIAADQQQLATDQTSILSAIADASATDQANTTSTKTSTYIIYGIAGLMVITAIAILLKKKKQQS